MLQGLTGKMLRIQQVARHLISTIYNEQPPGGRLPSVNGQEEGVASSAHAHRESGEPRLLAQSSGNASPSG